MHKGNSNQCIAYTYKFLRDVIFEVFTVNWPSTKFSSSKFYWWTLSCMNQRAGCLVILENKIAKMLDLWHSQNLHASKICTYTVIYFRCMHVVYIYTAVLLVRDYPTAMHGIHSWHNTWLHHCMCRYCHLGITGFAQINLNGLKEIKILWKQRWWPAKSHNSTEDSHLGIFCISDHRFKLTIKASSFLKQKLLFSPSFPHVAGLS